MAAHGAAISFWIERGLREVAVVVAAEIVGIEIHGVLIGVLLAIDRGLVEQPRARAAVGATDIVDAGIAGEGTVRVIAPRTAAAARGVAKGLMMAAATHHGADAAHQERAADHAGRCSRRGAEERAAAAEGRRAIGLAEAALTLSIRSLAVPALSIA